MSRFVVLAVFAQAIILQATYAQCVNRLVPNCGCSNIVPVETILPNQLIYNQLPNILPNNVILPNIVNPNNVILPNIVNPNNVILPNNIVVPNRAPCGCQNILPYETIVPNQLMYNPLNAVETVLPGQAPVTVIQDSSVANNLANALQLLVVSNLLSNTLPGGPEVMVPNGVGGFNYLY